RLNGVVLGYSSNVFQGQPAFLATSTHPDGGFNDPRFSYELAFQRDEFWYTIGYHLFKEVDQLPDGVQRYFDSFQIPAPPTCS
ncbi:MAG: hypothetical protein KDA93_11695, partial [Planctomycetaceae bacterium]|nr:hypothetical protein [Planctomycetaceae bacterium]